jgi:Zn-dependent peptidase ImmA (M78 family)
VNLRRGFKSHANAIARDVRRELGLGDADRLNPWTLAEHLGIQVLPLSSFGEDAPHAADHFLAVDPGSFSAVTVFDGSARCIVVNDEHTRKRQASDLSHELAHALLRHEARPCLDERGCRNWDENAEREADWLAGALLVSEEAALIIVREHLTVREASDHYGASEKMIGFRLNVTGARKRLERAQLTWRTRSPKV